MSVFSRKLKKPYFVSKPIIQNGHDLSCCRQHRSARENPPISVYLVAVYPLPHHFVPGTLNRFDISLRCLQNHPVFIVLYSPYNPSHNLFMFIIPCEHFFFCISKIVFWSSFHRHTHTCIILSVCG